MAIKGLVENYKTIPYPSRLNLSRVDHPGILISVCGLDGSGKTTAINTITEHLDFKGYRTKVIKMPTVEIRQSPYFREYVDDYSRGSRGEVDVFSLFLVLMGDRLLMLRKLILPLLNDGYWVICDRYIFTTFAELTAFDVPAKEVALLTNIAELFPRPDVGFVMNVDAETAIGRIRSRPTEQQKSIDEKMFARFERGFLEVALANELTLISTDRSRSETKREIVHVIEKLET